MKRRSAITIMAVLLWACLAVSGAAQDKPAPTYESVIAQPMAQHPRQDPRNGEGHAVSGRQARLEATSGFTVVLEELRHVTIGLEMTTAQARGEKFDFEAREKADASKPKTRASMVAEMEAAIAASYPLVQSKPRPQLIGWIEHQGEHYGKLVTAYRVNGIVPPVSRPKS